MARRIPDTTWLKYIEYRNEKLLSLVDAANLAEITFSAARKFESGDESSSGYRFYGLFKQVRGNDGRFAGGPIPLEDVGPDAKRALQDFPYFRVRYSGMRNSPWQDEAAAVMSEFRADDERRYVVFNMPPESGKTTFIRDFCAQMTAQERSMKGLIGSFGNEMAWNMMTDLGTMLTRQVAWQAPDRAKRAGARDAEATMWEDFGRFKPEASKRWNRKELLIEQFDAQDAAGKEATWTSYGRESRLNLGSRYDFIVWDDLVTGRSVGTQEALGNLIKWWDTEGETRLNEGGLLVLLGQRISSTDLYRHALDKLGFDDDDDGLIDLAPTGKKFFHIAYKAHYEDECKGDEGHARTSEPWRPDGTGGCLLEPRRVGYKHVMQVKINDANHFSTQYQQEDGDPAAVLVPRLWIDGGRDEDGSWLPGCWDADRDFWELPGGLGRRIGVITVDPSPTKYWAIQAWVVVPDEQAIRREDGTTGGMRYLVAMMNRAMDAPGFLEYHTTTRQYSGVLEEWNDNFNHLGVKLKHVIFEEAAAQRWALQYEIVRTWYRNHDVRIHGHKTHGWNKPDPLLGLPMVKPAYRDGRVRLPGKSRQRIKDMIYQLTNYGSNYAGPTDQVMANWFLESNLPNIVKPLHRDEPQARPGLLRRMDVRELMRR